MLPSGQCGQQGSGEGPSLGGRERWGPNEVEQQSHGKAERLTRQVRRMPQVLPLKQERVPQGQLIAARAAEHRTERGHPAMIGNRGGHVPGMIAGQVPAKGEIEVLQSSGQEERIEPAQGGELPAVHRQHGTGRGGEARAANGRFVAREQRGRPDQPPSPAHGRLEALVGGPVEEPAHRRGHEAGRPALRPRANERLHQRVDGVRVQLDVVVQQDRHPAFQLGHHVVERAEPSIRSANHPDVRIVPRKPRHRVVAGVVVDHCHAAPVARSSGCVHQRGQTLLEQPTSVEIQHQEVYEHGEAGGRFLACLGDLPIASEIP